MKKIFSIFSLLVVLAINNSCKNDLDATAPYKESIVVYGLIDPADSVNYIRVNRVFLGQGDATQVAQIQDSVYFKPGEASVVVEKYFNGALKQSYLFSETYEKSLVPGAFNTNQLIYKSTQKFKTDTVLFGNLSVDFEYVLRVKNHKTGTTFESSKIKLVKNVASNSRQACSQSMGNNCFLYDLTANVFISPYVLASGPVMTGVVISTPTNCAMTGCFMNMYYREVLLADTSVKTGKKFTYDLGEQKAEDGRGGVTMDYSFSGKSFFEAMANSVVDNSSIKERIADSIVFTFYFAGNEYKLYREINNVSGSFGQEKPIYTNMKNGSFGVFSSRTKILVNKKMHDLAGPAIQVGIVDKKFLEFLRDPSYSYCRFRFRGPNYPVNTGC